MPYLVYNRCHSLREEKQRKEEEEKEARKRAEEEERKRREEEEETRRRTEEEEERRRIEEEEEAKRNAEEEDAKRRVEEEEAAKQVQEAEKRLASEPQTREDPDIELVTEETLDDNLSVQEREEERGGEDREVSTSTHTEEEQAKNEEQENRELDLEANGTLAEAGPQLDEKEEEEEEEEEEDEEEEDLENQTLGESDSKPALPSDVVPSSALTPSSVGEVSGKQPPSDTSTPANAQQKKVRTPAVNRGPLSRSQEKREQRRRRGLEHNQRETERASSSSSAISKEETSSLKSKSQETSKLKERTNSKELDQYTFVPWKMKEDKGKKEAKMSPPFAGPTRPSTLPLQPADSVPERNGLGEGAGAVNLHRRPGAIKEKPEKWKGRRSDGELSEGTSPPPPHNREDRRKKTLYVLCFGHVLRSTLMFCL